MQINTLHVAKLASLPRKKEDAEKFQKQLAAILDYIKKLDEVDTKNIDPTSQVTGLENVMREDNPNPSLSQEEVLKNVKSRHNGFFKVKAIFKE